MSKYDLLAVCRPNLKLFSAIEELESYFKHTIHNLDRNIESNQIERSSTFQNYPHNFTQRGPYVLNLALAEDYCLIFHMKTFLRVYLAFCLQNVLIQRVIRQILETYPHFSHLLCYISI